MKANKGVWAGLLALTALGGCLGLPSEQEIVDAIAERAEERLEEARETAGNGGDGAAAQRDNGRVFAEARNRIGPMPGTGFSAMPVTGTAGFEGAARLAIEPAGPGVERVYVGRAILGVDFGSSGMAGRINEFERRDNGRTVDGMLILRDGEVGVTRPNDFELGMSGTLIEDGRRFSVSDRLRGDFRGTPIKGAVARGSGTADWNDWTADYTLDMVLEAR